MLAALVVLLRTLGLLCRGHGAVALENVALRQQLSVLRRSVMSPFWPLVRRRSGLDYPGARRRVKASLADSPLARRHCSCAS